MSPTGVLAQAATRAPDGAGVYAFLGPDTALLYVGKAGSLRRRLRQHAGARPSGRRLDALYRTVASVRWEELPDERTAAVREADLIAALRPPFNAESAVARRWPYLLVEPAAHGRLKFRLAHADLGCGRAYGCFPHLGRGLGSPPGMACSDGYTALLRLLWAASDAPGITFPSGITRSAPDTATLPVEQSLRQPLHAFLSGTGRRVLDDLRDAGARRGPYLQPGLARDLDAATGFFVHGPQALRRLRLRHGEPAGPLDQALLVDLITADLREAIGDFVPPAPPDPADAHLARKATPWAQVS
jgi:hypothetical protein